MGAQASRPSASSQAAPEQRRLEHVQAVLGYTRRGRLAAALALGLAVAASHARPHLLPPSLPSAPPVRAPCGSLRAPRRSAGAAAPLSRPDASRTRPLLALTPPRLPRLPATSQLLLFLTGELATLLAAALLLPRGAGDAQRRPRPREGGDTGWLSVLGVAATLIPAARRPLTMLRAGLGVAVALADDAALFVLTLLLARAAAAPAVSLAAA